MDVSDCDASLSRLFRSLSGGNSEVRLKPKKDQQSKETPEITAAPCPENLAATSQHRSFQNGWLEDENGCKYINDYDLGPLKYLEGPPTFELPAYGVVVCVRAADGSLYTATEDGRLVPGRNVKGLTWGNAIIRRRQYEKRYKEKAKITHAKRTVRSYEPYQHIIDQKGEKVRKDIFLSALYGKEPPAENRKGPALISQTLERLEAEIISLSEQGTNQVTIDRLKQTAEKMSKFTQDFEQCAARAESLKALWIKQNVTLPAKDSVFSPSKKSSPVITKNLEAFYFFINGKGGILVVKEAEDGKPEIAFSQRPKMLARRTAVYRGLAKDDNERLLFNAHGDPLTVLNVTNMKKTEEAEEKENPASCVNAAEGSSGINLHPSKKTKLFEQQEEAIVTTTVETPPAVDEGTGAADPQEADERQSDLFGDDQFRGYTDLLFGDDLDDFPSYDPP